MYSFLLDCGATLPLGRSSDVTAIDPAGLLQQNGVVTSYTANGVVRRNFYDVDMRITTLARRVVLVLPGETNLAARNRVQRALTEAPPLLPLRQSNRLRGLEPPNLILPQQRRSRSAGPHRPRHNQMEAVAEYMERMERMQFAMSNKITKLNGKNWAKWRKDMELRFKAAGYWDTVSNARPAVPDATFLKKEAIVLEDIFTSCEQQQCDLIMDAANPKHA